MQQGESTLVCAPTRSVTLFDRAYFSTAFLCKWQASHPDCHWLMRAKDHLRCEVVTRYSTCNEHIRMPTSPKAQKWHPNFAKTWDARLIVVQQGGRTRRYISAMMDPNTYPKRETSQNNWINGWNKQACLSCQNGDDETALDRSKVHHSNTQKNTSQYLTDWFGDFFCNPFFLTLFLAV